jgi:hypothetical protein
VYFFEGPVLLVGRTVVFFGTNLGVKTADREYDRARVIVIDHDNAGSDTYDCKIGLMTSTRPRRDHAPCTASTILIRTQYPSESELEPYVRRGPRADRVLRLDTDRFATHMGHILDQVIANDDICAPFKENWLQHIRKAQT